MIQQKSQNLNPEKAEILGLLCAEGSHCKYTSKFVEFDKRRGKSYNRIQHKEFIEFSNNDPVLQNHFIQLLKSVYNYERKVTGVTKAKKVTIIKKDVIKDILLFGDFGYMKWRVPSEILYSKPKIKIAFLKGFYEGDGIKPNFNKNGSIRRVRFCSKNKNGLKQLMKLLSDLNIKSNIYLSSRERGEYELTMFGDGARKFIELSKPLKCRDR